MTEEMNPWKQMAHSSVRRTELPTPYDFFWMLDEKGRMGLKISFSDLLPDYQPADKTGSIIQLINRPENGKAELYLLIAHSSDKDVFYSLCLDLIRVSQSVLHETDLWTALEKRLHHWQRFMKQGALRSMPEQLQMGLYAELCFLQEIMDVLTPLQALSGWVGPDFDKQDFSFQDCLTEIKCFITSKGPFIKISSLHQLYFDVKPLYLTAFGVSKTSTGRSVLDIIAEINTRLTGPDESDLFEKQLNQYGYYDGITEGPYFKYHTDSRRRYRIESAFPRIVPGQFADEILSVQYSVDLSKCTAFEVDVIPFL
jgi:hypothetical protein